MKKLLLALCFTSIAAFPSQAAIVALAAGTYAENFDGIGTTAAAGWDVRTGATATALGTTSSYIATPATGFTVTSTQWNATAGNFKNFAAAITGVGSTDVVQAAATDRALGIRQTGTVGDPGGSFSFNFSSANLDITTITIDLQMLSVQPRSTVWTLDYGIGVTPTSFTALGTFTDPGVFGSTTITFTAAEFGTNLNDLASGWFRVTALSSSTGSGNRDAFAIDNFSIVASPIPEPAAVLLGGLGMLGMLRRRRF